MSEDCIGFLRAHIGFVEEAWGEIYIYIHIYIYVYMGLEANE